jgi:predicted RNase H-like HicB family nuclease
VQYVYPAIFHPEPEGGFSVYFPDIQRGATQGETLAECIEMAEDFLVLALYAMEEAQELPPQASGIRVVSREDADIVTLISVDTDAYRRYHENRLVKKTLNIPAWLNRRAEDAHVNFSQILQKALRDELRIE